MTVSHEHLFKSISENRLRGRAWAALGQGEHERIAKALCRASGYNPDLIVHVEAAPLERCNSPDGVVFVYREQDWGPMWCRYVGMAERLYRAGLLAELHIDTQEGRGFEYRPLSEE